MISRVASTASPLGQIEAFERYVRAPYPHATLVLVAAGLDERRTLTKLLLARATVVRCGELEDVADAERWVRAKMTAAGMTIAPEAVHLLVQRAGPDVARLRGDVERLVLFAADRTTVTAEDVREVVGPAVAHDESGVARAIERGQADVALRELGLALDAGAVPFMVLGQLAWVVRNRIAPGRVARAVDALFRTDQALKSSAGDPRVLLERLVVELCGVGGPGRST